MCFKPATHHMTLTITFTALCQKAYPSFFYFTTAGIDMVANETKEKKKASASPIPPWGSK